MRRYSSGRASYWQSPAHLRHLIDGLLAFDARGAPADADLRAFTPAASRISLVWQLGAPTRDAIAFLPDEPEPPTRPPVSDLYLAGPRPEPTLHITEPGGCFLALSMRADTVARLFDVSPGDLVSRQVPLADVLTDPDLLQAARAIAGHADLDATATAIFAFVEHLARLRPAPPRPFASGEWLASMLDGLEDRSPRTIQRFVRSAVGLPLGLLRREALIEDMLRWAVRAGMQLPIDWKRMSHEWLFSDRSHLSRIVRKTTGFPPETLIRRARTEAPFWPYRLILAYVQAEMS